MDPAALAWVAHDTRLISCCLAAILAIVLLIGLSRLPPFLSILIGTFIAGLGAGLPAEAVAKAFSKGAGGILGEAGIIIALGSMLGALMAESGAADRIAGTLLGLGKGRSLPWVMALVAMVIGLPLFFEVGLVLMVPIIFVMAQRSGQPLLRIAIPALAIGAGSVFFCQVNDAGFWMVRGYFGLELKQTLWVWSVLQTLVSVTGLAGTLLLSLWL